MEAFAMNENRFRELWSTRVESSSRMVELDQRLRDYYLATQDCDNHKASQLWRVFKSWANNSGYSAHEINQQKLVVCRSLNI